MKYRTFIEGRHHDVMSYLRYRAFVFLSFFSSIFCNSEFISNSLSSKTVDTVNTTNTKLGESKHIICQSQAKQNTYLTQWN